MPKTMLIDSGNQEEVRVCLLENGNVEDFDFESASRKPLRGNIYLARVTRVEPSLQAAFIEYGGNRHGFLAFGEIHPDYYQIPISDRRAIQEAEAEEVELAARLNLTPTSEEDGYEGGLHGFIEDVEDSGGNEPVSGDGAGEGGSRAGLNADEQAASNSDAAAIDHAGGDLADDRSVKPTERAIHLDAPAMPQESTPHVSSDADDLEYEEYEDDDAGDEEIGVLEGVEEAGSATSGIDAADAEDEDADEEEENEGGDENQNAGSGSASDANSSASGSSLTKAERAELMERYKEARRRRARLLRNYKIQEVIKRRQILLIQVVKEERGNKGAALTTYMSLAGRYCVLMPNTARGGGISRKIPNASDRKRLRRVVDGLDVPQGMGLIIRTAGASRTKAEIKRDYDYLIRLWENIRSLTLKSIAPCLIYEEASLIKRAIRDLYDKDIDQVLVEGDAGYREAKDFMKMLMPSHAKNVQPYKDAMPLFLRYGVEAQLDAMYQPIVRLKSGGYIVINQTEALIAIDVNSGKSTRERNVELTALRTNLEAAKEVARQCRMRDLAGLVVVDFIDMEEGKNNRAVEKRLKDAMRTDRARIQIGRISSFGLLEMSRQRRRSGIVDGTTHSCSACGGAGVVRSPEMAALRILRSAEAEAISGRAGRLIVRTATGVALYILNHKRDWLRRVEEAYGVIVEIAADPGKAGDQFEIEATGTPREVAPQAAFVRADLTERDPAETDEPDLDDDVDDESAAAESVDRKSAAGEGAGRKRRRRRRRKPGDPDRDPSRDAAGENGESRHGASVNHGDDDHADAEDDDEAAEREPRNVANDAGVAERSGDATRKRRRRGRRGGRRNGRPVDEAAAAAVSAEGNGSYENGSYEEAGVEPLRAAPSQDLAPAAEPFEYEQPEAPATVADAAADDARMVDETPDAASFAVAQEVVGEPQASVPEVAEVGIASVSETAAQAGETVQLSSPAPVDKGAPVRKGWWQRALGS